DQGFDDQGFDGQRRADQMRAVMAAEAQPYGFARLPSPRRTDEHAGEIAEARKTFAFDERRRVTSDPGVEMSAQRRLPGLAQARGPLFPHPALDLRHPRRRRAGAWAEGKNVHEGEGAFLDQCERARKVRFALGGEARNEVGAVRDRGTRRLKAPTEVDGLSARMAALHTLQDKVVSVLQREVQIGRHALVLSDELEELIVHL